MKGFYSVMQYCPDRSRSEAANVGVVLFTEQPRSVAVRLSEHFARVQRFFRPGRDELERVKDAARATAIRLRQSVDELATAEALDGFTRAMGNDIRLTPPKVVVVADLDETLGALFGELVEDAAAAPERRAVVLPTPINRVFEQLTATSKVWRPGKVRMPWIGRELDVPFAYRNGVVNYIKPAMFAERGKADDKAATLALQGDQLRRHPEETIDGPRDRQLVVVSAVASDPHTEQRIAPLFEAYGVIYVPTAAAEAFAAQVLREAR